MQRLVVLLVAAILAAPPITLAQDPAVTPRATAPGPAVGATAKPPDTPVGRRLAEFLEVLGTTDRERIRALVQESFAPTFRDAFPMDEHLDILGGLAARTDGLDLVSVEVRSPTELSATVRGRRDGRLLTIEMEVEGVPPNRIAGIGIRPGGPGGPGGVPAERPAPAPSPEEAARQLRAFVDELAVRDQFSGAVLLAEDGAVLLHAAWGQAEKAFDVPNRPDTKFNLGSMNKMFTAVAVARLVEEGRLSFDDPIGKYLGAEWLRPGIGERVTIGHLLTHTSGLGSYFSPELMERNPGRFRDIDDFQEIVRKDSLAFEPGTRWRYSNTGFLLLGAIIEKVTGRSYYDVVRELVYEPAGMTATDAYAVDEPTPNLAVGYERALTESGPSWRANYYEHVVRGGPAGGGYSTAPDLLAFARALRENRLLSPEMTRRVTTPKPELGSPEYGYGFGFWDEGKVVGHTGGAPGINAALLIDMERGITLVVLANYGGVVMPVVQHASALLGYAPER